MKHTRLSALLLIGLSASVPLLAQAPSAPQPVSTAGVVPPASLVIPSGTLVTIEITDHLSSNSNHVGDSFTAVLRQPVIVDGWVVARPGQTVIGRVSAAERAGRIQGKSSLALELQELVLVDGQQLPVQTQFVQKSGQGSTDVDTGIVATGGVTGALIGAAADGGKGAAIGAAAGAGAGLAGVLLTPGRSTEIGPEATMAFRLTAPIEVSTERSPRAFLPVSAADYRDTAPNRAPTLQQRRPYPPTVMAPPPVWSEIILVPVSVRGRRR
jgi:hypothetical protein